MAAFTKRQQRKIRQAGRYAYDNAFARHLHRCDTCATALDTDTDEKGTNLRVCPTGKLLLLKYGIVSINDAGQCLLIVG